MKFAALSLFFAALSSDSQISYAFVNQSVRSNSRPKISSTELYIIGPMIRKMREENEQKKMPMASDDERVGEAAGLRVGSNAWKWPPVWPYDGDSFTPKADIKKPAGASPMTGMLGQLGGMPAIPEVPLEEDDEEDKFDIMKYWQEEKGTETTDIDAAAAQSLSE